MITCQITNILTTNFHRHIQYSQLYKRFTIQEQAAKTFGVQKSVKTEKITSTSKLISVPYDIHYFHTPEYKIHTYIRLLEELQSSIINTYTIAGIIFT